MVKFDSPFTVKLWATLKDANALYFLLEPCMGGELFVLLRQRTSFSEPMARFYAACVVLGMEHIHNTGYVYRGTFSCFSPPAPACHHRVLVVQAPTCVCPVAGLSWFASFLRLFFSSFLEISTCYFSCFCFLHWRLACAIAPCSSNLTDCVFLCYSFLCLVRFEA
jgi:hypothetical protein